MLLNEIKRSRIESKDDTNTGPMQKYTFHPAAINRFKKVGSGFGSGLAGSDVFLDTKHPNRVVKVVRIRHKGDQYLQYLRLIEHHQNNPFFPKLYGYKLVEQPDSSFYLYVFMEKLLPLTLLDKDVATQLLQNVGLPFNKDWPITYSFLLRYELEHKSSRQEMMYTTQYPQFKKAMKLLEPLIKLYGNDMHVDNFMVRLTSVGPQLVIIDPLMPSTHYPIEDFDDDDEPWPEEEPTSWMKYF